MVPPVFYFGPQYTLIWEKSSQFGKQNTLTLDNSILLKQTKGGKNLHNMFCSLRQAGKKLSVYGLGFHILTISMANVEAGHDFHLHTTRSPAPILFS